MAAVAPLPPNVIRELLEKKGYKLLAEDPYNWAFALKDDDPPIIVPHTVDLVPLEIAFSVMLKVGFDLYSDAIYAQADAWPSGPPPTAH